MAFCDQCGAALPPSRSSCATCGAELGYSDTPPRSAAIAAIAAIDRETKVRYVAIGIAVLCGVVILATGVQLGRGVPGAAENNFLLALLLLIPPLLGAAVVATRFDTATTWLDRADGWIAAKRGTGSDKRGWFRRLVIGPTLWCFAGTSRLATRVDDSRLRTGIKVSVYTYLLEVVLFLAYVVTAVVVVLLLFGLAMLLLSFFLGDGDRRSYSDTEPPLRGAATKGATLFSGTNWLNEKKTGRVDDEGNVYSGSNWLNERKTGRVEEDGTVVQGSNWLNEKKVGRVDEDGNIFEGANWLSEEKVGRVDESGNIYEGSNWLNEKKVGRVEPKDD